MQEKLQIQEDFELRKIEQLHENQRKKENAKIILQTKMDTKLIQNDVMIANFEADPEKRTKIFKNEIQVYTKEHELDLEQHKEVVEAKAQE